MLNIIGMNALCLKNSPNHQIKNLAKVSIYKVCCILPDHVP